MAWIATAELVSAVSNAGGLGTLSPMTERGLSEEMKLTRELTKESFSVNLPVISPNAKEMVETIMREGIRVVTTSVGDPRKFTSRLKKEGVRVMHVVTNVKQAKKAEDAGVDAVIAMGFEAGGHVGKDEIATFTLVPSVVRAVDIPVVAAGGICDGRGLAAALMLGAKGVQIGTRFIATEECVAHENFKRGILEAKEDSTTIIGRDVLPARVIKNEFSKNFEKLSEESILDVEKARLALLCGDTENGAMWCGQAAGMIKEVKKVKDVVEELVRDAERIISQRDR